MDQEINVNESSNVGVATSDIFDEGMVTIFFFFQLLFIITFFMIFPTQYKIYINKFANKIIISGHSVA